MVIDEKTPKKTFSEIQCPFCNGKNYLLLSLNVTTFEYTPQYVEGRLVNQNPNYFIQEVRCTNCDVTFEEKL